MLAQRKGRDLAAREVSANRKTQSGRAASNPAARPKRPNKLSFKDKHALENLPTRIAALEADIAKLEATLADPALFTKDPDGFNDATSRLAAAQTELAAAEDQWLELEMKREAAEG